ncbi:hypothetical protein [Cytobacillus sp. IB215316]|uniref:hypothetical protein n=1 Tax=Cytobacillus sp. IB215316 TaxID=3097354 RepID=UPI002A10CAB3|nr:hypothetical protein [Cytobacillus sp. IB215316]MDX8362821.1 hypothetical protein [Cytobacillus sp. IB215316]
MLNWFKANYVPFINYLYESLIVYFCIVLLSIFTSEIVPVSLFFLLYVVGAIPIAMIIYKMEGKAFNQGALLYIPFLFVVALFLNIPVIEAAAISIVSVWRLLVHLKLRKWESFEKHMIVSMLVIPIVLVLNKPEMLYLLVVQVLFFPIVRRENNELSGGQTANRLWGLLSLLIVITIVFVGKIIIPMIYKVVTLVIAYVATGAFIAISWIVSKLPLPPLTIPELFETEGKEEETLVQLVQNSINQDATGNNTFIYVLIVIIVGLVIYLLFKRKAHATNDPSHKVQPLAINNDVSHTTIMYGRGMYSSHGNRMIRKRFDRLEHHMAKKGRGRKVNETVHEWLHRLDINHIHVAEFEAIYKKARYGEVDVSKIEKQQFIQTIKEIKNHSS